MGNVCEMKSNIVILREMYDKLTDIPMDPLPNWHVVKAVSQDSLGGIYYMPLYNDKEGIVSVAIAKGEKDARFPLHKHTSKEILIMVTGGGQIIYEDGETVDIDVTETTLSIDADVPHRFRFTKDESMVVGILLPSGDGY